MAATGNRAIPAVPAPSISFLRLFSYADKYDYGLMALGTLAAIAHGLADPAFFYILAKILNAFALNSRNSHKTTDDVAKYAEDLVYIGIATFVGASAELACWTCTRERQASRWQAKYLEGILTKDVDFFDTDVQTVDDISNNMLYLQDAIGEKVATLAYLMAIGIGGFVVAFWLKWKMGMITLAFVPTLFAARVINAKMFTSQKYNGSKWSIVEEAFDNIRTVHSFNYGERVARMFADCIPVNFKYVFTIGLGNGFVVGMSYFTHSCFLWYGGILVRRDEATGANVLAATLSAFHSAIFLLHALAVTTVFSKGRDIVETIIPVMSKPLAASEKTSRLPDVQGDLELRNVAFAYPSRPTDMVLRNVSFSVPAGEIVALVGAPASGKSTVVSLITRFYSFERGSILLDNTGIDKLHLQWYRDQIGLINQEPVIFATSISDNIRCGKADATVEEVEAAAKAANAHTFITKLPDAYRTQVRDCDVQLSESQKLRLVIARAVLKDAKLLLVDAPTQGLSAASEYKVQAALEHLMVGRSSLVIAHRLSTVQNAHSICVLQDGRIVERGTHDQLLRQNEFGPYSVLVKTQEMALGVDGTVLGQTSKAGRSTPDVPLRRRRRDNGRPARNPATGDTDVLQTAHDEDEFAVGGAETTSESENRTYKRSLWRLLKMSALSWPSACVSCIAAMFYGAILETIFGFVLGELLQVFYKENTEKMKRDVQKYALALAGAGGAAIVINMVQHFYCGVVMEMVAARVQETLFRGALQNEVGWFDQNNSSAGRLKMQLARASNSSRVVVSFGVTSIPKCIAGFIAAFAVSFIIEWRLTLVMLATFPLMVLSAIVEDLVITNTKAKPSRAYADSDMAFPVAIRNIRTIGKLDNSSKVLKFFSLAFGKPAKHTLFWCNMPSILFGLSQMLLFCVHALIFWYASTLLVHGTSDLGSVVKVFLIISVASQVVAEMFKELLSTMKSFKILHSTFVSIDRLPSLDANASVSENIESMRGSIEMVDVEFAYPTRPDITIMKNLSLNVKAREHIALVGAKGSGKSSLIALVQRFYDPIKGSVMIDGKDIRGLDLHSLRQSIGLVQSDPVLFPTSMDENIQLGQQGASAEEIQRAAEAAEAHIFIHALPGGYNAKVGDPRVVLNRGQQQRLAIARVVLKNPAILLIDDATAGLDDQQEKVVQAALDHLMEDRTTIVVTHNLADICVVVDRICVLEGGCIVEQGTHAELMEAQGTYAGLFNIQRAQDVRFQKSKLPPGMRNSLHRQESNSSFHSCSPSEEE